MDFMPWLIIFLWASSKHQSIYRKYKGIEIVIKTKIYLGDTYITDDCNRSDMCIPWPIGVVAYLARLVLASSFFTG